MCANGGFKQGVTGRSGGNGAAWVPTAEARGGLGGNGIGVRVRGWRVGRERDRRACFGREERGLSGFGRVDVGSSGVKRVAVGDRGRRRQASHGFWLERGAGKGGRCRGDKLEAYVLLRRNGHAVGEGAD